MTRKIRAIVVAVLFSTALTSEAVAGKADNSLRFASQDTLESTDPYFTVSAIGYAVADIVWDTLIFRDPKTGQLKGELATAWRWIDDKTLELDLRQGVKFHNGAEFSADDVVYTLDVASSQQSRVLVPTLVRWIDHVEKLGQFKVRIVAKQPFPGALAYLASAQLVIHPHEYLGSSRVDLQACKLEYSIVSPK